MWILDWFVNLDNLISLLTNFAENTFLLLNLFFKQEKNADFSQQTSIFMQNFLKLWPNWKTRSICGWMWQKICCHKNVLSSERALKVKYIKLQKLNFLSWKFTTFVGKNCKPTMFHTSCLCELVKRGWVIVSGNLRVRHSPSQLSLAAVYKKFLALKLHKHSIAVFAVFAMFTRLSIAIF